MIYLDDGVNRASLLAKPTINALGHVNIILGGSPRVIGPWLGLYGDSPGRASALAQLARYAALLAGGVPAQSVLTPETW